MDLIDGLRNFATRAAKTKDVVTSEDATKTSLVMPFFQLLGYDIFNPLEFAPEFTADFGTKKGEKVDYAIMQNDEPVILIECKKYGEALGDKHASQLFRYYSTTAAKFGILTDGITYKFYTDFDEQNKMDIEPFLIFSVLDVPEHITHELKRFTKKSLDVDSAYMAAVKLKYTNKIKELLHSLRAEPSENFVKYILSEVYKGKQMQKVIEQFKPIVKRGLNQYINDNIRDTLTTAMRNQSNEETKIEEAKVESEIALSDEEKPLAQEELEAFAIIKAILGPICDVDRLVPQNGTKFVAVLLDGNRLRRVCRFWFKGRQKHITTPDENRKPVKHDISSVNDIYKYADFIRESCERHLNKNVNVEDEIVQDDETEN